MRRECPECKVPLVAPRSFDREAMDCPKCLTSYSWTPQYEATHDALPTRSKEKP